MSKVSRQLICSYYNKHWNEEVVSLSMFPITKVSRFHASLEKKRPDSGVEL